MQEALREEFDRPDINQESLDVEIPGCASAVDGDPVSFKLHTLVDSRPTVVSVINPEPSGVVIGNVGEGVATTETCGVISQKHSTLLLSGSSAATTHSVPLQAMPALLSPDTTPETSPTDSGVKTVMADGRHNYSVVNQHQAKRLKTRCRAFD